MFNLAHFTFALTLSYLVFGTSDIDIISKSTLILVITSISTALLILFQPFEHLFWLIGGRKSFRLNLRLKWIFWSQYLPRYRMTFVGGCYFLLTFALFFGLNPLGIQFPWLILALIITIGVIIIVIWNALKSLIPATLVAKIWGIEINVARVRDKFESVTPQGVKVSEVVFQIFSLLSTARTTLLNGSHEEAGNYVAIVEGLIAPVIAVLDPNERWQFF